MTLGELIAYLKARHPARRVPVGFARPCSYRGYYEQLAFEVEQDTTVGAMLAAARSALGQTFTGYKGGEYVMDEHTAVWLVRDYSECGVSVGPLVLAHMVGGGMKLAVIRGPYGGPNDVATYAALMRELGWSVSYWRTPPLTEAEAPGVLHGGFDPIVGEVKSPAGFEPTDVDFWEPAEFGYDWTARLCENYGEQVYPVVWQNLPLVGLHPEYTPTIFHRAGGFIARSAMAAELLRSYGIGHERIHQIPPCVDTERFRPGLRSLTGADQVRVLYAGRDTPEKGLIDLIFALRTLPRPLRDRVRLVLAGCSGPPKGAPAADDPDLAIEYLGHVPHHEMPAVYQSCHIFVYATYPTEYWLEQWGLSVVEAMASALPVVTTDVGAFREILPPEQHSQWMVPARDWVTLRSRLATLIENPSLRGTLGRRNREWAVQHFSGAETAARYQKAFGKRVGL